MDLLCWNQVYTNAMLTTYFIFCGVSGLVLTTIPDTYGRRFTTIFFLGALIVAQVFVIFWSNFYVRFLYFIVAGLCTLKVTTPTVWGLELVDSANANFFNTLITTLDMGTITIICLYYYYISRDSQMLLIWSTAFSIVAFLMIVYLLPESPKWLLATGKT